MRLAFAISLTAVIGGCARDPEKIPPAYVSPAAYKSLTCRQLREEETRLLQEFVLAAGQQYRGLDNDVNGLILPVVPVTVQSFSTEDYGPQIAVIKGQMRAVYETRLEKGCT